MQPLMGGIRQAGGPGTPSNMLLGPQQQHLYEAQLVDVSDAGFAPLASVSEVCVGCGSTFVLRDWFFSSPSRLLHGRRGLARSGLFGIAHGEYFHKMQLFGSYKWHHLLRIGERQRGEDEPKILETTIGHVVLLLSVAPTRSSGKLEASVDKLFDKEGSGEQRRHQKKRKTIVAGAGEPSHPPKKLREDHGTLSGASIGGKSRSALQRLLVEAMLNAEVRGGPIPTLPFVTSSVFATLEREDEEKIIEPSLLSVGSALAGGTNPSMGCFAYIFCNDFLVADDGRVNREMVDEFVPPKFFAFVCGMEHNQLFTEFNMGAARQMSISAENAEGADSIFLCAKALKFKVVKRSLLGEVYELEVSFAVLREKLSVYENYTLPLERLLVKLLRVGLQDGLATGITHDKEGRVQVDVDAYNPSTEVDYVFALQKLQSVNFSLLAELKLNKDSSVETLMNILRLEETLAKRLGLNESQSHVDQLMVPIHHSPNQTIVGVTALSLSLEVSYARVQNIRENIANYRSAIRDIFIPLAEPLSTVALEGIRVTFDTVPTTADTTTAFSMVSFAVLREKLSVYENYTEQLEKFQDEQMKVISALGAAISKAIESGLARWVGYWNYS
nr:hypothetical protein [Tanacetum cinerariifolium]